MALPGAKISDIKTVYSHVHALGQCRHMTQKCGWKTVVDGDTAGAAKRVRHDKDLTIAALAPELAAKLYQLEILMRNVEDAQHNTTRFMILSRERKNTTLRRA